jgi:hypothetical protein
MSLLVESFCGCRETEMQVRAEVRDFKKRGETTFTSDQVRQASVHFPASRHHVHGN